MYMAGARQSYTVVLVVAEEDNWHSTADFYMTIGCDIASRICRIRCCLVIASSGFCESDDVDQQDPPRTPCEQRIWPFPFHMIPNCAQHRGNAPRVYSHGPATRSCPSKTHTMDRFRSSNSTHHTLLVHPLVRERDASSVSILLVLSQSHSRSARASNWQSLADPYSIFVRARGTPFSERASTIRIPELQERS